MGADSLFTIAALSIVEGYLLQRTVFEDNAFRTVCLQAFGVNLALKVFWDMAIYPFFVTPLRHLPQAPVSRLPAMSIGVLTEQGYMNNAKIIFDEPRGRHPLQWMKTISNEGLIHFRDVVGRSYLLATNHKALLDIMSTNTYDFEKPWRFREFLARIIGFGLILSEGAAHKKQRKALNPSFNIKNIRALYNLMWEKTGLLLDELENETKQYPVEGTTPEERSGKVEMSVWAR